MYLFTESFAWRQRIGCTAATRKPGIC